MVVLLLLQRHESYFSFRFIHKSSHHALARIVCSHATVHGRKGAPRPGRPVHKRGQEYRKRELSRTEFDWATVVALATTPQSILKDSPSHTVWTLDQETLKVSTIAKTFAYRSENPRFTP